MQIESWAINLSRGCAQESAILISLPLRDTPRFLMGSAVESALDCRSLRSELRQGFSFNQDKTIASNPCKQFLQIFGYGSKAVRIVTCVHKIQ